VIFTLASSSYCMSKVAFSNSLIIVHSKFFQQFPVIFCLLCSTVLFINFFVTYLQLTFNCKIDRIIYASARCLRTILIFQKSDFKIVHARTHALTRTNTHTHTCDWNLCYYVLKSKIYLTQAELGNLNRFWLSCLSSIGYGFLVTKDIYYLTFQSFAFEHTWWILLYKRVVSTRYLGFYF
jgi:hypothetical protein